MSATSPHNVAVRTGFAGLANQGATCYMNSLLQTLFMTPEFRRVLYMWRRDPDKDDEPSDCIPYQLQSLFGHLQLTTRRAVSTTALTKSFGWSGAEAFQQHDVQELARVLFDALERSLAGTPNAQLINDLFKGSVSDYLRCRVCGKGRSRHDTILDLSLVIKPWGSTKAFQSIEDALQEYVRSEVLDGDNSVLCESCAKKTAHDKGLAISEPPYLLQLQLKRFVFNPYSMAREKLDDRVTFPLVLDLNPFVEKQRRADSGGGEAAGAEPDAVTDPAESPTAPPAAAESQGAGAGEPPVPAEPALPVAQAAGGTPAAAEAATEVDLEAADQAALFDDPVTPGGKAGSGQGGAGAAAAAPATPATVLGGAAAAPPPPPVDPVALAAQLVQLNGPHVYELYSVLVHSGSANGGHYYAYIMDLDSRKWFNFNDSSVTAMTVTEVLAAAGGQVTSSYSNYTYLSHANAYMLMYRRVSSSEFIDIPVAAAAPAVPATASAADGSPAAEPGAAGAEEPVSSPSASTPSAPAHIRVLRSLPVADDVPAAVLSSIREIEDAERAADKADRKRREQVTVKLWFQGSSKSTTFSSSMTVLEATQRAWKLLGFDAAAASGEGATEAPAAEAPAAAAVDNVDEVNKGTQTANFDDELEPSANATTPRVDAAGAVPPLPLSCIRLRKYSQYNNLVGEPLSYDPRPAAPRPPPLPPASSTNAIVVYAGGAAATEANGWGNDDELYGDPPQLEPIDGASRADAGNAVGVVSSSAAEDTPVELEDGLQRTLESYKISIYEELIVETRAAPSDPWPVYDPNGLSIQVIQLDSERGRFKDTVRVTVARDATLAAVAAEVAKVSGIPRARQRLIKADVYGGRCIGYEYLTNVAMGLPPSPDGATTFPSPPLDSQLRIVGDGLRVFTDLDIRSFDRPIMYVEVAPAAPEFEPFADLPEPAGVAPVPSANPESLASSSATLTIGEDAFGPATAGPLDDVGGAGAAPEAAASASASVAPASVSVGAAAAKTGSSAASRPGDASSRYVGFGSSSSSYTGIGGSSYTLRGLRTVTAETSGTVALLERKTHMGKWKYNVPGTDEMRTVEIDVRISANEVYALFSELLGLRVGTFSLQRDTAYGAHVKLGDTPGALRFSVNSTYNDGTVLVTLVAPLEAHQSFGAVYLYTAPEGVVYGTSWAPIAPPPPPPPPSPELLDAGAATSAATALAAAAATAAATSDDWLPLPIPATLAEQWAAEARQRVATDSGLTESAGTLLVSDSPLERVEASGISVSAAAALKPTSDLAAAADASTVDSAVTAVPVALSSSPSSAASASSHPSRPPGFEAIGKIALSVASSLDELRSACVPLLVRAGALTPAEVQAGQLPPPPLTAPPDVAAAGAAGIAVASAPSPARAAYSTALLRRLRIRSKSGLIVETPIAEGGTFGDVRSGLHDSVELCVEVLPPAAVGPCETASPLLTKKVRGGVTQSYNYAGSAFSTAVPVGAGYPVLVYIAWFDRVRGRVGRRREVVTGSAETSSAFARRLSSLPGVASAAQAFVDSAAAAQRLLQRCDGAASGVQDAAAAQLAAADVGSSTPAATARGLSPQARFYDALCYFHVPWGKAIPPAHELAALPILRGTAPIYNAPSAWRRMADDSRPLATYGIDIRDGSTLVLIDADVAVRAQLLAEAPTKAPSSKGGLTAVGEVDDDDEAPYWGSSRTGVGFKSGYSTAYSGVAGGGKGYYSTTYAPRREAGLTIRTKHERDAAAAAKAATSAAAGAAASDGAAVEPSAVASEEAAAPQGVSSAAHMSASAGGSSSEVVTLIENPLFARRRNVAGAAAASTAAAAAVAGGRLGGGPDSSDAEGVDPGAVSGDLSVFDALQEG